MTRDTLAKPLSCSTAGAKSPGGLPDGFVMLAQVATSIAAQPLLLEELRNSRRPSSGQRHLLSVCREGDTRFRRRCSRIRGTTDRYQRSAPSGLALPNTVSSHCQAVQQLTTIYPSDVHFASASCLKRSIIPGMHACHCTSQPSLRPGSQHTKGRCSCRHTREKRTAGLLRRTGVGLAEPDERVQQRGARFVPGHRRRICLQRPGHGLHTRMRSEQVAIPVNLSDPTVCCKRLLAHMAAARVSRMHSGPRCASVQAHDRKPQPLCEGVPGRASPGAAVLAAKYA